MRPTQQHTRSSLPLTGSVSATAGETRGGGVGHSLRISTRGHGRSGRLATAGRQLGTAAVGRDSALVRGLDRDSPYTPVTPVAMDFEGVGGHPAAAGVVNGATYMAFSNQRQLSGDFDDVAV